MMLFLFTAFMFFTSVVNMFKLEKEARTLVMFITAILFLILTWTSFTVEGVYCVYTTEFLCHVEPSTEFVMAMVNVLFMIITILYLVMDFMGKIPNHKGG